jgi:hypothetical protein
MAATEGVDSSQLASPGKRELDGAAELSSVKLEDVWRWRRIIRAQTSCEAEADIDAGDHAARDPQNGH